MLSGLPLMRQASFFECLFSHFSPSFDNGLVTAEVNVGGCETVPDGVILRRSDQLFCHGYLEVAPQALSLAETHLAGLRLASISHLANTIGSGVESVPLELR
jgi:hypothetical protein